MKKCKTGYYYCNTDKKCKPIPSGYRVGFGGYLRQEKSNGKKNGNGNGMVAMAVMVMVMVVMVMVEEMVVEE